MHEANFANYDPEPFEPASDGLPDPEGAALDILHGRQDLSADAYRGKNPGVSYLEEEFERDLAERQRWQEPDGIACARALMVGLELRTMHAPSAPNSDEQL